MKLLFAHRVYPGQFRNLLNHLAKDPRHQVAYLAYRLHEEPLPSIKTYQYRPERMSHPTTHPCLSSNEDAILFGQAAWRAALRLKNEGFNPDVIIGHSGWGSTLYLKDVFPQATFLGYFEWFYRAHGSSHGFHPNIPLTPEFEHQIRTKNVTSLIDLEAAKAGLTQPIGNKNSFRLNIGTRLK